MSTIASVCEQAIVQPERSSLNIPSDFSRRNFTYNINSSGRNIYARTNETTSNNTVYEGVFKLSQLWASRSKDETEYKDRFTGVTSTKRRYKVIIPINYESQTIELKETKNTKTIDATDHIRSQIDTIINGEKGFINKSMKDLILNEENGEIKKYLFDKIKQFEDKFQREYNIPKDVLSRIATADDVKDVSLDDWKEILEHGYQITELNDVRKRGAFDAPGLNLPASKIFRVEKNGAGRVMQNLKFTMFLYHERTTDGKENFYFGPKPWEKEQIGDLRKSRKTSRLFNTKPAKSIPVSVVERIIRDTDASYDRGEITSDSPSAKINTLSNAICHIEFSLGDSFCFYTLNQATKVSIGLSINSLTCLADGNNASVYQSSSSQLMNRFGGDDSDSEDDIPEKEGPKIMSILDTLGSDDESDD